MRNNISLRHLIIIWEGDWYSDPDTVISNVLNEIDLLRNRYETNN